MPLNREGARDKLASNVFGVKWCTEYTRFCRFRFFANPCCHCGRAMLGQMVFVKWRTILGSNPFAYNTCPDESPPASLRPRKSLRRWSVSAPNSESISKNSGNKYERLPAGSPRFNAGSLRCREHTGPKATADFQNRARRVPLIFFARAILSLTFD